MSDSRFLLLVVVLGLAYWLVPKVVDAVIDKVHRLARPNEVARDKRLLDEQISFTVPARPAEVLAEVAQRLNLEHRKPSGLRNELFIFYTDDETMGFAFGNSMGTSFTAALHIEPTDSGSQGVYEVDSWNTDGATLCHREQIEQLSADVQRALCQMQGQVSAA